MKRFGEIQASVPWKVAGYERLSRDDGLDGESDSVIAQKLFIEDWAASRKDVEIVGHYVDDGYSGANFDRPGFARMIEEALLGKFDTIAVKDLSRFGRSYLDCGSWIERELPRMGIRLYSISDNFDSMESWDYDMALLLPMKNLMNEMQVITTSAKVRASLRAKRERGEFVGNFAPYGYRKDPADKHRLLVDPQAAPVVQRIFRMFQDGCSATTIARKLNEEGVPCPALHRRLSGQKHGSGFAISENPQWHPRTITRILRDERYTGTLVQGKTMRTTWRLHESKPVKPEEWCRCEGMFEALVDRATFDMAQGMLDARGKTLCAGGDSSASLPLADIQVLCASCNSKMIRLNVSSSGKNYRYYACSLHRKDVTRCAPHSIRAELLEEAISERYANGSFEPGCVCKVGLNGAVSFEGNPVR